MLAPRPARSRPRGPHDHARACAARLRCRRVDVAAQPLARVRDRRRDATRRAAVLPVAGSHGGILVRPVFTVPRDAAPQQGRPARRERTGRPPDRDVVPARAVSARGIATVRRVSYYRIICGARRQHGPLSRRHPEVRHDRRNHRSPPTGRPTGGAGLGRGRRGCGAAGRDRQRDHAAQPRPGRVRRRREPRRQRERHAAPAQAAAHDDDLPRGRAGRDRRRTPPLSAVPSTASTPTSTRPTTARSSTTPSTSSCSAGSRRA